jgi:thiamine-phosphate pyrophosphorylase
MSWKEEVFQNFKLYAVTDLRGDSPEVLGKIEAAYDGGADIVQLRSKHLTDRALYELGKKIRLIAESKRKLFFVNDRPDLALAVEADGVHLGQDDLTVAVVRQLFLKAGKRLWIGKSTHSLEQGRAAILENPDYLGVGPVFGTPTKPGYKPAGLEYVKQAAKEFTVPFVAIGGIDQSNIKEVLGAGASRIAVVRAIFDAENVAESAQKLREEIENYHYA